ncbi:right-handed parallel beta-helix repeat-containing protein [Micromonospora orduensis]|uniref:Right-handed parallel beta-helix repeat-containing protein n=1 Tax=Micromonospora orduensis TaxID=1420891 RepID=A0A5C4QX79_9ACTN|nr:RICIN domain-containing protein [Micromonospora orduensis]TNH30594.1 right-handed parallel beta-helix repeat-containing protein [Micromonospora orduensis]
MKSFVSTARASLLAAAVVVSAALPAVLASQTPAAAAAQQTFYVAPDGSDANPGTIQAPFRTLQRARDVVRTVNATMTGDINVYLRGGSYPVSSTIEFGAADSGTNGFRVSYSAYSNEKPVLDGGVQVTGWTQHSGNIWKAPLDRANKLRALYVNDKRAYLASKTVSSAGCYGTYTITAGQADWAWESGSQCDGARYNLADFPAIARNHDDIEIETGTTWTTAIVGVRQVTTSSDGASRVALFQQPGAAIAQGAFNGNAQVGGTHKLMNAYEFLDAPGEFYFDKSSRTVYYYKSSTENMATATVYAPNNVSTLLRVAGTSTSSHARNITFSGLTVQHSDWNLVNVAGSAFKQAQQGNLSANVYVKGNFHVYYYRNVDVTPGIVQLQNADGILLHRNRIQHTGADGINMVNDVQSTQLTGNHTNDVAGSAITVGHPQHVYIGDGTSTNREKYSPQVEGLPKNIDIRNNYLYDSAVLFNGHSPISAYFADTLTISRNRIEKAPWSGITMGWGWWNFDGSSGSIVPNRPTTTARNNTISYNHIIDTVQRLSDTAPIYTLGSQPGATITNNYLQGVPSGHKYGLHPDEGSAFITFRDNVLSIDKNVTWMINSDDFGRKHDLSITQIYGPINKVSNKNLPNSTVADILVSSDYVWPAAAYAIAANSGLEDAYRDILPASTFSAPNYVLPASTFVASATASIPIRSTGDATRSVWLAPSGTTAFVAGPTMTRAAGTATSIAVPRSQGEYRLYVLDAQGNRSAESTSIVRQQGGGGSQQGGQLVGGQSGRCVEVPNSSTTNGTQVQLWDCGGGTNQRWTSTASKQLMVYGNKCLDASGAGTANGTQVIIWDCHGGLNQQWNVNANGTITNGQSGLCLDANGAASANGTKIILWSCNGGANQQWSLRN